MRCDLLIVLPLPLFVRNYVSSGFLGRALDQGWRIAVVAPQPTLAGIRQQVGDRAQLFPIEPLRPRAWRHKLVEAALYSRIVHLRRYPEYAHRLRWLAWRPRHAALWAQVLGLSALDRVADAEQALLALLARQRSGRPATELIRDLAPRAVLWTTNLSLATDFDILQAARHRGAPIAFAEGSWDNLTSKGPLWPRPDRVWVWGAYSAGQARERHGVPAERIAITGPPHFQVYVHPERLSSREAWCRAHGVDPARPLVLYAGTTGNKSGLEGDALKQISRLVDTGELPPLTLWYRPHPRARGAAPKLPHLVLDPEVRAPGLPRVGWTLHDTDALQRAEVLSACDVIVSAYSTMTVEAALLGKPGVLLAPGLDKEARADLRVQDFAHLELLGRGPLCRSARNASELRQHLTEWLQPLAPEQVEAQREFGRHVADCSSDPQGRMLVELAGLLSDSR